ncbi:hypothetical protein A4A49_05090, partial [Nicotiana attenuata]
YNSKLPSQISSLYSMDELRDIASYSEKFNMVSESPKRGRSLDTQVAHQQNNKPINQQTHMHQDVHNANSSADATSADSNADVTNIDPSSPADVDTVPNQADVDPVQHLDNAETEEMAEMFDNVSAADNEGDGVPDTNSTDTNLRRSGRTTEEPLWLEDYVTTGK